MSYKTFQRKASQYKDHYQSPLNYSTPHKRKQPLTTRSRFYYQQDPHVKSILELKGKSKIRNNSVYDTRGQWDKLICKTHRVTERTKKSLYKPCHKHVGKLQFPSRRTSLTTKNLIGQSPECSFKSPRQPPQSAKSARLSKRKTQPAIFEFNNPQPVYQPICPKPNKKFKAKKKTLSIITKKKQKQKHEGYFMTLKQTLDKEMREIFSSTIKAKRPSYINDPFKSQLNNQQIPCIKIINRNRKKSNIRDMFSPTIKAHRPSYINDPFKSQLDNVYQPLDENKTRKFFSNTIKAKRPQNIGDPFSRTIQLQNVKKKVVAPKTRRRPNFIKDIFKSQIQLF